MGSFKKFKGEDEQSRSAVRYTKFMVNDPAELLEIARVDALLMKAAEAELELRNPDGTCLGVPRVLVAAIRLATVSCVMLGMSEEGAIETVTATLAERLREAMKNVRAFQAKKERH